MDKERLVAMVKGVQAGDDDAMTQMYSTFHDDLYYYIYKTVHDPELAADLTQDTFMEILQCIGSLQEPAAFISWSRQIAFRRCTAYFKKHHDLLADEDEDGYSVFDTIAEDRTEFIPDEALDKEDLKQTIHAIINELPEEQRNAIMLRYLDEIPVAQIAQIQGVSEGTVKSRLNYGRKAIKRSVEEYEKKHNIKLHSFGILPLLLWILREHQAGNAAAATAAAATTTTAAATTTTAAATATATTTAVAAKAAGTALAAKIVAGVLAASVAVGGVALGLGKQQKSTEQTEPPATESTAVGCEHQWNEENTGICDLCGVLHNCSEDPSKLEIFLELFSHKIYYSSASCTVCGHSWGDYYLPSEGSDQPIPITVPADFIWEHLSEESHAFLLDLLKDTWKISEDPNVTVTPIGALYFYNDTWDEESSFNNRLVVIYHLDNGVVPGGWYTYLGPNGDVVIKTTHKPEGPGDQAQYTTVLHKNFVSANRLSFLWIEGLKEYYSGWGTEPDYPNTFQYEGVRYMGHATIEDCLTALQINGFDYWGMEFQHMRAFGQMREYVTDY